MCAKTSSAMAFVIAVSAILGMAGAWADVSAKEILEATGIQGGFVVHLGCGAGELTAALRANDSYTVHGLDADPAKIAKARRHLRELGLQGPVSAEHFDGARLPYADNLINLVVVSERGNVSREEIQRVLTPEGVAYVRGENGWRKHVKPRPENIDDWSHFLHDASNNAVAKDTAVGPPRELQWIAPPLWLRSHETPTGIQSQVSAGGRLFYLFDEGLIGITDERLPDRWSLICRDAFNGKQLWRREIAPWGWREWAPEKWEGQDWTVVSGGRTVIPMENERRLVADGERLYATLGYTAPMSILDAATGAIIKTVAGTENTIEILVSDGVALSHAEPPRDPGARRRGEADTAVATLTAVAGETGEVLWHTETGRIKSLFLAIEGSKVVFQEGEELVSLSLRTGEPLWRVKAKRRSGLTLVLADGVALIKGSGTLDAYDMADGALLWERDILKGSSAESVDIFVVDGVVWPGIVAVDDQAEVVKKSENVLAIGLDLRTGEEVRRLHVENFRSPEHHHRCYRNKATERFIISGLEGAEFLDLNGDDHSQNNFLRGACKQGIMPCNGLLYVPPDQCFCHPGSKLLGYAAVAPVTVNAPAPVPEAARLVRGPAYGKVTEPETLTRADWPAYRPDAARICEAVKKTLE